MLESKRKVLTIVTEALIESQLIADLKRLGAHGYTIVAAQGEGARGKRSAGWEENQNIRVEVICDERVAQAIVSHLVEKYYSNYAMTLYAFDVQVVRPEKF